MQRMLGIAVLVGLVAGMPQAWAQWTTNGANISYTTGTVGIGTTNPGLKLEVYGVASAHTAYFYNPAAAGTSFGPLIDAGGNSSDWPVWPAPSTGG